jgi:tRNA threonylcarbamoyladenosine modification (KEOPS) complex Cgi121 subunit/molybdopterin converting factor small subunit
MITIRLLGGAKRAVGKPSVILDRSGASIPEILNFLRGISTEPRLLHRENLIVAINGVDSSALRGENTVAKDGDTVTVVTVVHGGILDLDRSKRLSLRGAKRIESGTNTGELVDRLRSDHRDLAIQALDARSVFGIDHVLGVLRISLEAERRKVMLANKLETELLLRIACTDQISEAMQRAGLKPGFPACFMAFSGDVDKLCAFEEYLRRNFDLDDSVLEPTREKLDSLSGIIGRNAGYDRKEVLNLLLERAAIMVK